MSMTDPVADLLTRIRNGAMVGHEKVNVPASRLKANIVRVLKEEGFVRNFRLTREDGKPVLKVYLKYDDAGTSVIKHIRRVSKPGKRVYSGYKDQPRPLSGLGVTVFSTSKGIMTGKSARANKLGGEWICEVW